MDWVRVGVVLGFIAPIVGIGGILCAIISYPLFSWTQNALSDLGVVDGMTQGVFNGSLCVTGVLVLGFVIFSLYEFVAKTLRGQIGVLVFGVASGALSLIGIFTENNMTLHYSVALGFFILAPLALFIFTLCFYTTHQYRLALFTVAMGLIAILPWILLSLWAYVPNVAIPELISAIAISAWIMGICIKLYKTPQKKHH
ncbi:MAG: DUF998 domain-containing protein [Nitrososphaerota archaeon]|jgi:hypothetical membrane protein|nr:DUF998 domain-containing protein [Nitrososphaerota archaeon]